MTTATGAATAAHAGAHACCALANTSHGERIEVKRQDGKPALGTVAKSVDGRPEERRRQRHALQDVAAKLLPGERVHHCRRTPTGSAVSIHLTDGRAQIIGLQTCGALWVCPICYQTIALARRDELRHLLNWTKDRGYVPLMLTLTVQHHRDMPLRWLLEGLRAAKKRFHQSRNWRALRAALVGHVTATETPCGKNGWHVHTHTILLVDAKDEAQALRLFNGLRTSWECALQSEGLTCNDHGFDLRGAAYAGDYLAKWGAAEELALSGEKATKGRSPWQLLGIAGGLIADDLFSAEEATARWLEYAAAFRGRRQLVWSRGLKTRAGVEERSDEEILATAPRPDTEVARLSREQWQAIVRTGLRIALLEAVEVAGADGLRRVLAAAQIRGGP